MTSQPNPIKGQDNLIENYRTKVINGLLDNSVIVDLLTSTRSYAKDNPRILVETNKHFTVDKSVPALTAGISPEQFTNGIVTEAQNYIFFDLDELYGSPSRNTYQNIALHEVLVYFWVVAHKQVAQYKGLLANDVLSKEIKYIMRKQVELGVCQNELMSNVIYDINVTQFTARVLTFRTWAWCDEVRYGEAIHQGGDCL
jgi:hypothetical protein